VKNHRLLLFLLIAGAIGVWIGNAYTIVSLIAPHPAVAANARRFADDMLLSLFNEGDKALKCKPKTEAFTYNGNFENPFRILSETFAEPVKKRSTSPMARVSLILKGVLLQERPLAILDDGTGKTYICGIGETIQEHTVVSIEPSRVTLRGSQGVFTLSVKE
jgi:hypothetical protein